MVMVPLALSIPIAAGLAGVGWYARHWMQQSISRSPLNRLRKDYFAGLNYLLNEQPDKAVDVFIRLLDTDEDTFDTHLSLGMLFRRRGEIDRAIKIHQNLVGREHLSKHDRSKALVELAQDYLSAGVYNRAESLYLELVEMKEQVVLSLRGLLKIYQREKNWQQAILVAEKLSNLINLSSLPCMIAQFHCQLSVEYLKAGKVMVAQRTLRQALRIDKNCVRANIHLAAISFEQRNYKEAILYYKCVSRQDELFMSEVIGDMVQCYLKLKDESGLLEFLQSCMEQKPRAVVVLALTQHFQRRHGDRVALDFIVEKLKNTPSLKVLVHLVGLYRNNTQGAVQEQLNTLHDLTSSLLDQQSLYRCGQCGFSSRLHMWLCPGCEHWNSMKPIDDIEESA